MQLPRIRFRIRWFMVAVAILAVLLAWLDPPAVVASVSLALVVTIPAALAPRGQRLKFATLAASFQPMMVLLWLYATWVTAWYVLGHRPRPSLDDPKFISPVVDLPYAVFFFSVEYCGLISFIAGFLLATACWVQYSIGYPMLILLLAWMAGLIVLIGDPFQVLFWYFD